MKNNFQVNISAIITKGEKVLLVQRSDTEEVFPGLWGIPGGKVDNTDKDILAALKREIREEVGIEIKDDIKLLSNNIVKKEDKNVLYIIALVFYKSGSPKALEDTKNVGWFKLSKLPDEKDITPYTFGLINEHAHNKQRNNQGL